MARCEGCAEKNHVPDHGVESYIQGGQDAGDDDKVVFFGGADSGTIENRKRLKLSRKCQLPGWIAHADRMEEDSQVIMG
jgi:hypothetical protein